MGSQRVRHDRLFQSFTFCWWILARLLAPGSGVNKHSFNNTLNPSLPWSFLLVAVQTQTPLCPLAIDFHLPMLCLELSPISLLGYKTPGQCPPNHDNGPLWITSSLLISTTVMNQFPFLFFQQWQELGSESCGLRPHQPLTGCVTLDKSWHFPKSLFHSLKYCVEKAWLRMMYVCMCASRSGAGSI